MNFLNKNKTKYIVAFCIKEGITYRFEKTLLIKPNTKLIKYDKDNVFIVDIENPTYRIGNNQFYCIDINSKQVHMILENEEKKVVKNGNVKLEELKQSDFVSSRITKSIFLDNIIGQLASSATHPIRQTYDYKALVIGLIIGGLLCLIIGYLFGVYLPLGR